MTTSVFHIEHAERWLPLLEVPQQDWDRLSSTFHCPRKLFLFVLGCYAGCEGTFRHAPDAGASENADLSVRESTAHLYFFPSSPVRPLPARTWMKRTRSSSDTESTSTQNSETAELAKTRDEESCVITGNIRYIRVAHVLPKAYGDAEVQYLSAITPDDRLADGQVVRNKVTLLTNARADYDDGRICLLRVPNWSLGKDDVHLQPPVPPLGGSGIVQPTTISSQRAVLYVNVAAPDPQIHFPTGRICRLSDTSLYPPSWLLDIGVARSFLITFGVPDSYTAISSLHDEERNNVSNPNTKAGGHDLDASLDTDPSVGQPSEEKGPSMRSMRPSPRTEAQQRRMQVDEFLLSHIRQQAQIARELTNDAYGLEDEEGEEPLPTVDIDAWLAKLSLDNAGTSEVPRP